MPYIHFTEQEKQQANQTDITAYLTAHGETVKKCGSESSWESPNGKVSIRGSSWYSQYERVGGGAVGFLQKFYGLSYPEAVRALLGQRAETGMTQRPEPAPPVSSPAAVPKEEKPSLPPVLPPRHSDMRRLFAYLTGERCIDRDVLHAFTHAGLIYEDAEFHNAVFVGTDENGKPMHAQKRSTRSGSGYKGNVAGSQADYSFHFIGQSEKLFVFEAPIDLLAYISLHKEGWEQHSYVALCSTADCAALWMLKTYPHIKSVYLCLDHDSAGIEGAYRIAESIRLQGEYSVWRKMPRYKDWDEVLKALHGHTPIPSSEITSKRYATGYSLWRLMMPRSTLICIPAGDILRSRPLAQSNVCSKRQSTQQTSGRYRGICLRLPKRCLSIASAGTGRWLFPEGPTAILTASVRTTSRTETTAGLRTS